MGKFSVGSEAGFVVGDTLHGKGAVIEIDAALVAFAVADGTLIAEPDDTTDAPAAPSTPSVKKRG